jgi:hypothetical protein
MLLLLRLRVAHELLLVLCPSHVSCATVLAEDWLQVLLVPSYLQVC